MPVTTVNPTNQIVTVWVCPPVGLQVDGSVAGKNADGSAQVIAGYYFPFSLPAAWRIESGLIPDDSDELACSMGTCAFQLMRQTRMDTHDNAYTTYQPIMAGMYVAIMEGTGQLSFQNNCLLEGLDNPHRG